MSVLLSLEPRDPLVARDGRPFGAYAGNRMRPIDWPLPSTVAGAIRTLLGHAAGGNFDAALIRRLKQVACHGPLPVSGGRLFLPAPGDALLDRDGNVVTLRPEKIAAGGADLPHDLQPVVPPPQVTLAKFQAPPPWWSVDKLTDWLLTAGDAPPGFCQPAADFRLSPAVDERTHVAIDPVTLAALPQLLFTSAGLVLDDLVEPGPGRRASQTWLSLRVDAGGDTGLAQPLSNVDRLQTVGGERRLLRVRMADAGQQSLLDCPARLSQELARIPAGEGLRMVLATPAVFSGGWRPGWLNEQNGRVGTPPCAAGSKLKLRLVAVANQRWDAVSGWSYETRGPKAVKRVTPAGGVYFFQVESADGTALSQAWLQPVSDDPADRGDGYGLATWGRWQPR